MSIPISTPGVLKLRTNVPETISLAFADGKPVQSQYSGDQIMFSLDDGRKLYLPPAVASEIGAAGIGAHQPFVLTKVETAVGSRRTLRHIIQPVDGAPGAGAATTVPGAVATAHAANTSTNGAASTNVNALKIAAELAAELAKPEVKEPEGRLMSCYKHAIDVVLEAKRYASERGLLLEPKFDDIRQVAATLFIDASRNGARV